MHARLIDINSKLGRVTGRQVLGWMGASPAAGRPQHLLTPATPSSSQDDLQRTAQAARRQWTPHCGKAAVIILLLRVPWAAGRGTSWKGGASFGHGRPSWPRFTTPLRSNNPVVIAFQEWSALGRDLWQAPSWHERLACLIGPRSGAPAPAHDPDSPVSAALAR